AIMLDAVAVSCGPGSYTGLRIGVSMSKGICYGRDIPLIGIPTHDTPFPAYDILLWQMPRGRNPDNRLPDL
ncbi:tRNA threonylcarbamoyladenosine biosynthesis protein TsaB, partial [termite gut metagenome]